MLPWDCAQGSHGMTEEEPVWPEVNTRSQKNIYNEKKPEEASYRPWAV